MPGIAVDNRKVESRADVHHRRLWPELILPTATQQRDSDKENATDVTRSQNFSQSHESTAQTSSPRFRSGPSRRCYITGADVFRRVRCLSKPPGLGKSSWMHGTYKDYMLLDFGEFLGFGGRAHPCTNRSARKPCFEGYRHINIVSARVVCIARLSPIRYF